MQGDRRPLRRVLHLFDGVGALTRGLPARTAGIAGLAGDERDPVGDHERRVEAHAELADQFPGGRGVPRLPQFAQQLRGAGAGDRADQPDHLVTAHADAVVADGQGALLRVDLDLDVQVGSVDLEVLVDHRLDPQLVQGV